VSLIFFSRCVRRSFISGKAPRIREKHSERLTSLRDGRKREKAVRRKYFSKNLLFPKITHIMSILCGGIAQLGERLHGMQEVNGSIPFISTTDFLELLPDDRNPILSRER
jgi:hypothetical protein